MIPIMIMTISDDYEREFMERMYIKYYALMRKYAYEISQDAGQVDDIINDACIKLINKISLLRTFNSCILTSYIVYTVRSVAIDFVKHRAVASKWHFYGADDDMMGSIPCNNNTPEDILFSNEHFDGLYEALDQLPERDRTLLQYKYFFDMNDKEIALAFNIKKDSVREYLSRARKRVYKLLREERRPYDNQ